MKEITISFFAKDETGKDRLVILKAPLTVDALKLIEADSSGKELSDSKTSGVVRAYFTDSTNKEMVTHPGPGGPLPIILRDVHAFSITVLDQVEQ
jgi:hypothetical protein